MYKLDVVQREIDEAVIRLERYLDYRAVCSGDAMKAAKQDYQDVARQRQIRAKLPEAWCRLVEDEDELLLELIADRVESLCGYKPDPDTVAAFLREQIHPKVPTPVPAVPRPRVPPAVPPHGQLPQIGFDLDGRFHPARNACDVLVKVFAQLANRDATFLERFAALPKHGRTRRYLARKPNDLYPGRPDLGRDFSRALRPGWWLGVNHSRATIGQIIAMSCEVAGLRYGVDLKVNLGE